MRSEDGYSLTEVLIVMALLVVVLGALMNPIVATQKIETKDANYADAQQQAQSGLESMVNQIRQATAIISSGGDDVQMNLTLGGNAELVEYNCSVAQTGTTYDECVRVQTTQGGTLPTLSSNCASTSNCQVVVRNLQNYSSSPNVPVFTWGPDANAPYYMTATIQVPSSDGSAVGLTHALVFSDGTLMRNLNIAN